MSVSQNLPNLAIGYSVLRLLKLLGASLLLTLLSAAVAFNWFHVKAPSEFQMTACYVGVALFGFMTCRTLWRLVSSRQPVLFITRVGIRDTRVAYDTISWRSVRDVSVWRYRSQAIVVLKLDPLVADRFDVGLLKRVVSVMNKAVGAEGVLINPGGLTMDGETLLQTCRQYWKAGRLAYTASPATQPEPVN
ncbi:STM3941 family protein [Bradyrhizobium centrosematis]|uniref:STM3941 family protein n=1 Tax=Bradyrhizobium centrosematis TaxID=1300039 RepID=UPI00388F4628